MLEARQRPAPSEYHHTEAEWASVYPHIQRMYIQERRKLRYVMAQMEEKYGFKATSHMYKKRFTKWGLEKNVRLSRRDDREASSTAHSVTQRKYLIDLLTLMELGYRGADAQSLLFLNSIKSWSSAFFETTLHDSPCSDDPDFLIPPGGRPGEQPLDLEQLSFSFRLVAELLGRGHGIPAGRLARKSFLQVEKILDLEGPLVTWDLLEILYNIAYLGQTSLFAMLVRHISDLAKSRLPTTHPLIQILASLQDLMRRSPGDAFLAITTLIERGWLLNAGFIFSNVHSRFQLMYHRLIWDSYQLRLPPAAPRRMSDSFGAYRAENPDVVQVAADFEEMEAHRAERIMYATLSFSMHTGHAQRSQPPSNYEALRLGSIADLRRQSEMELVDQHMRLRVLMGLMKRGMPDSATRPSSTARDDGDDADGVDDTTPSFPKRAAPRYKKVPRLHVRVVAFMAKIALDTDIHLGIDKDVAIEKLRGILALREYGQGASDPQVVYEIWQLRDLLARGGRLDEAEEAAREASKRLDIYLADIPETL
ncbi:uncharacterized protein DNG_00321 [Cephalotrichum gorgonifer]|uniref:Clr5 domain-containing protein n=1 Tax=Cephalotrichum gorgonifer TaxID=2041049 RepID=A0AAE8MP68_9PEZI|nr:uncharacterized protein DNG_00321 [Cephalotrichum gorgonifer]